MDTGCRHTAKIKTQATGCPAAGGQLKTGEPWLPEFLLKSFAGSSPSRAQKPKSFPHSAMGRFQTFQHPAKKENPATASRRLSTAAEPLLTQCPSHTGPVTTALSVQAFPPLPLSGLPHGACTLISTQVQACCLLDTVHKVFQIQQQPCQVGAVLLPYKCKKQAQVPELSFVWLYHTGCV